MSAAIRVQDLAKQYVIGAHRSRGRTFREAIMSTARRVGDLRRRGRGQGEGSTAAPTVFWALKDVSFDVPSGQVLGIIGHNGAGKSTLLKVLSRITAPTLGWAELSGRVASLLEVGTGFHPELTGRENIFLNGAILGMRRSEIVRQFDEIVDFAEIDQFIDTAVKHYSSGMYLRLAFAVAAHLEPEILVVDEVLAVGDMRFQRKCMARMSSISHEGRTILFVSHNLGAIATLCTRAILLEHGRIGAMGEPYDVIAKYEGDQSSAASFVEAPTTEAAYIARGQVCGPTSLRSGDMLDLLLEVVARQRFQASVNWRLRDANGVPVAVGVPHLQLGRYQEMQAGLNLVRFSLGPLPLLAGGYRLSFDLNHGGTRHIQRLEDRLSFRVLECDPAGTGGVLRSDWGSGCVMLPFDIQVEEPTVTEVQVHSRSESCGTWPES
jgi:ABC-type polysaccharide/polyol phosphate transport system ATPase subunit